MISEMILASLSKIWHLIPIVIAIVLLKKFLNYKAKKNKIIKNEENEKNGLSLKIRTKNKYEALGYKLIDDKTKNQGIDLHMTKDDKTLLIQCKDSIESKSIIDEDIKTFHKDAINYVKSNNMEGESMELRYAIPYSDILHKSAIKILTNDSYGCKYIVV